jgi:hypothetical protein
MLALTDSALAYLAIAATAVAPEQRERWLRDLADRVDPPTIPVVVTDATNVRRRSPAAARQRRHVARQRAGIATCVVEYDALHRAQNRGAALPGVTARPTPGSRHCDRRSTERRAGGHRTAD